MISPHTNEALSCGGSSGGSSCTSFQISPNTQSSCRTTRRRSGLLFKDMLIRVTSFFREPNAFKVLAEKVLPQLLVGKSYDVPVRVWVCGCSSGEEAYSIAMMLAEHTEAEKLNARIQIFATDIDPTAIAAARGWASIPKQSRSMSRPSGSGSGFVHKGTSYQVKKELREMVVFAEQDVNRDAPFSKMDLVSCRNLLIYLEPQLQDKLLHIFHYALNTNGFLFLAHRRASANPLNCFSSLSHQWKIFQRKGVSTAAEKAGFYSSNSGRCRKGTARSDSSVAYGRA